MEHEVPYLVCDCGERNRYIVQRKCDGSIAGCLCLVKAGWEIEDESERRRTPQYAAETIVRRVFGTLEDAALFVYMGNRAYQTFINIEDPPERIEIRITPNLGQCIACSYGQWVASLYSEDGTLAGLCCADSLDEAKFKGLMKAHFRTYPEPTEEMRRISEEPWVERALEDLT